MAPAPSYYNTYPADPADPADPSPAPSERATRRVVLLYLVGLAVALGALACLVRGASVGATPPATEHASAYTPPWKRQQELEETMATAPQSTDEELMQAALAIAWVNKSATTTPPPTTQAYEYHPGWGGDGCEEEYCEGACALHKQCWEDVMEGRWNDECMNVPHDCATRCYLCGTGTPCRSTLLNGVCDLPISCDEPGADCIDCGNCACYNGKQDGDETDVDCGGSCHACGVIASVERPVPVSGEGALAAFLEEHGKILEGARPVGYPCSEGTFAGPQERDCTTCSVCGKGAKETSPCTATTDTKCHCVSQFDGLTRRNGVVMCTACDEGLRQHGQLFKSAQTGKCTPCSECGKGTVEEAPCSLTRDATCRCKPGYLERNMTVTHFEWKGDYKPHWECGSCIPFQSYKGQGGRCQWCTVCGNGTMMQIEYGGRPSECTQSSDRVCICRPGFAEMTWNNRLKPRIEATCSPVEEEKAGPLRVRTDRGFMEVDTRSTH